jgi:hypothetical protein
VVQHGPWCKGKNMTIVLNGTTGISNDGGYTGDGVVFADTTPANTLVTTTGGNVGIGTNSPSTKFVLNGGAQFQGAAGFPTTGTGIEVVGNVNGATNYIQAYNRTASTWQDLVISGNVVAFGAAGAERARIDSSGNLLVGTSSLLPNNLLSGKFQVLQTSSSGHGASFKTNASSGFAAAAFSRDGNNGGVCEFLHSPANTVGNISVTSSSTAYNTSSDYRLKEGIQPMTGALARVAALKPVTYRWKADGSDGQGFIAHELQAVCPDAVVGEKDAVDAEGNPVYQGIDTSFLVATLTAAIQELKAIVDAQGAEIAALKGTQP